MSHKKRCTADEARHEKIKIGEASVCKLKAKDTAIKNLNIQGTINGIDVNKLTALAVIPTTSFDLSFDSLTEGIFGQRTPIKPDGVNETVWNAMLENLNTQINVLGNRLRAGRERLALPQVLQDPQIVGTISLQPFFRTFPNDPAKQDVIQTWTNLGWNIEIANAALRLTQNNTPISSLIGSISGNVLTVTNNVGYILQGGFLSGEGIPENTLILEQLTRIPENGPFFSRGTYLLNNTLNIPEGTEMQLTLPQGERVCSILIQYGYIEKITGLVRVVVYDVGNRQFEPTIDFNPNEDPACVESWGEKYAGFRAISGEIINRIIDNMRLPNGAIDVNNTGCVQLAILRETGIITYFPGDCPNDRASTQVINPSCLQNCSANGNSSSATFTPTVSLTPLP